MRWDRENIIKFIIGKISKEINKEILKPIKYKSERYDGQINIWERFYVLDIPNKMKNGLLLMTK